MGDSFQIHWIVQKGYKVVFFFLSLKFALLYSEKVYAGEWGFQLLQI
jgi:hypothetical protein